MRDAYLLAARFCLSALYVTSAWWKWFGLGGIASALGASGYPAPQLLAALAASGELAGGLGIAVGLKTRIAAYRLVAYTVLAALTFHAYWAAPYAATAEAWFLHAWKNMGLIGGFLALVVSGPGRFSLDALLASRTEPKRAGGATA